MPSFPFANKPDPRKSDILHIGEDERERQWGKLVMIPSESICHPAAAAVLAGEMGHVYAEGLPGPILCHEPREAAADDALFQAWQTRLSDRRFYKGTINANRVELIAQARIADVFAKLAGSPKSDDIYVNVQALSGTVANLAVYEALLKHGDRMMGLDLSHGGHLTHGSKFNFSGKTYDVQSYGADPKTRMLDYDQLRARVKEFKPNILIGGTSSYPWDFDWAALRSIADDVGAYLLADIAHLSGMIAAGLLNNPLPHAHVVMFTTHKTLCGPRGAVILTAIPDIARKIDLAVFPVMQGGPHMNSIAAIGRLFELILEGYEDFCEFQRKTLANAAFFAQCLKDEGFALEYGGTNTHMMLVDLKKLPVKGETFLDGEIASRLLEIAGIVCNKNVLPGDEKASHASGLRFGTTWLTQRGVTREQLREIASIVKATVERVETMLVWSPPGERKCRGRLPAGVLETCAKRTLAIAEALPYPPKSVQRETARRRTKLEGRSALVLRGETVRLALEELLTARLPLDGSPVRAQMLRTDGTEIDDVVAAQLEPDGARDRWLLLVHEERLQAIRRWLDGLSDGYLLFDGADLQKKVHGPFVAEEIDAASLPDSFVEKVKSLPVEPKVDFTKPYFIGQSAPGATAKLPAKKRYEYKPQELPLRKTALNYLHHQLGAKMAPFAGWEMPIQYPTGILAEHRAVRTAAGLFDVSHMSVLDVSGPDAQPFMEALTMNCVAHLAPGDAQYSSLLYADGTHVDDIYVYRIERDRYMIVANASNAERVKDWVAAVLSRKYVIDDENAAKEIDGRAAFRDLRDAGAHSLIDLAFQGPLSRHVLRLIADTAEDRARIERVAPNTIASVKLAGLPAHIGRTGYTGERIGFEIYVHPDNAAKLWDTILTAGKPLGVLPVGLGARDSTRVEAGLPLFGHDLEGDLGISLTEAGYGFIARLHVPFFIGRNRYIQRAAKSRRHLIRLRGIGRKTLRAGHVILDDSGKPAGQVTSFAYVHSDMTFVALACVHAAYDPAPGSAVRGLRVAPDKFDGSADERSLVDLTALTRFPEDEERDSWPKRYA